MKKRLIFILISIMAAVVLTNCNIGIYSWYGTMLSRNETVDSWQISANTVNGNGTRTIELSSDNLNAFHVENKNADGTVLLKLAQGTNEKIIDITGEFNENIDMTSFQPGDVKIRVEFEKAKDVKLKINW